MVFLGSDVAPSKVVFQYPGGNLGGTRLEDMVTKRVLKHPLLVYTWKIGWLWNNWKRGSYDVEDNDCFGNMVYLSVAGQVRKMVNVILAFTIIIVIIDELYIVGIRNVEGLPHCQWSRWISLANYAELEISIYSQTSTELIGAFKKIKEKRGKQRIGFSPFI